MNPPTDPETLLRLATSGDSAAANDLVRRIYSELHNIARSLMNHERRDHTLQVTALVHEALLKLFAYDTNKWPDTQQELILLAARAMRQVLTDHARRRNSSKRSPLGHNLFLDDVVDAFERESSNLVALSDALDRLEAVDPVAARLVHLRFFVGMTLQDAARVLGMSERTAQRDWRAARAWLRREVQ
jgi:RNA polymerase sigma factor (TIGR02999 family)